MNTFNQVLEELFKDVNLQKTDNGRVMFWALTPEWKGKFQNCKELYNKRVVFLESPNTEEVQTAMLRVTNGELYAPDPSTPIYLWCVLVNPIHENGRSYITLRGHNIGFVAPFFTIPYTTEGVENIQNIVYSNEAKQRLAMNDAKIPGEIVYYNHTKEQ